MQSQVGGRGYVYLASVALVFSLVFGTASAQESSDTGALAQADPRELEVIIVTAQRREQAITDVPVSIAAFTEEMLIDAGVTSTEELVVLTPSITLNKHISPLQNTIRIRGVGTGVSVPTIESSVSMVVDGVVIDNQGVFFTDLIDIERIEVLRGPQSTLFGKNAAAGVLNIVTKAPSLEGIEGGIDASYNDYNDLKVRATLSGPIADNLAYRLTGIYVDEGDGVLKNVNPTGPKLDDLNTQGLRGKLLWMPAGDLEIMATLDYRNSEGPNNVRTPTQFESLAVQDLYGVGPVSFSNRRVNVDGGPLGRNDFESAEWGTSVEINLPFADGHTFTSITAYREWSLDAFLDIDGIGQQVTPAGFDDFVIVPGVGPVEPGRLALTGSSQVWNYLDTNQLSQEFRIASPTDQVFRYLAGLFYWQTDKDYDVNRVIRLCPLNTNVFPPPNFSDGDPGALTGACTVPPPNGVSIGGRNVYNVETTYFAAFGQIDWDFAEQWSLSAGLRIQQEDFDYRLTGLSALRGVDAATLSPAATVTTTDFSDSTGESDTVTTGKFSISYKPGEYSSFYAFYSRGYKGTGLNAVPGLNAIPADSLLEKEVVDAYEIGYKASLLDRTLNMSVALFYQEFDNLQVSAFDADAGIIRVLNTGTSRQQGAEFDISYRATQALDLSASVVFLDAEFLDFDRAGCFAPIVLNTNCQFVQTGHGTAIGFQDVSGGDVPFSPRWSATVGASYSFYFDHSGGSELVLRADYRYVDEQPTTITQDPSAILPSYSVVNLRARYIMSDSGIELSFFVNNVLDESYSVFRPTFTYSGFPTAAGATVTDAFQKDASRTAGMSVRFNF